MSENDTSDSDRVTVVVMTRQSDLLPRVVGVYRDLEDAEAAKAEAVELSRSESVASYETEVQ